MHAITTVLGFFFSLLCIDFPISLSHCFPVKHEKNAKDAKDASQVVPWSPNHVICDDSFFFSISADTWAPESTCGSWNERNWSCCQCAPPVSTSVNKRTFPSCIMQAPTKPWKFLIKIVMGRWDALNCIHTCGAGIASWGHRPIFLLTPPRCNH